MTISSDDPRLSIELEKYREQQLNAYLNRKEEEEEELRLEEEEIGK